MTNNNLEKLEGFIKILSQAPPKEAVQKRYDGVKYLPISYYEATLDKLFFGLWSTEILEAKQILNEVICRVQLTYTHPINNKVYTRGGVASVQIMQASKTKILELPQHKIPNALEMCLPKAKTEAIKNACKSLGKIFGRDLSRKQEHVTASTLLIGDKVTAQRLGQLTLVKNEIGACMNVEALNSYMRANSEYLSDKDIQQLYNARHLELTPLLDSPKNS